MANRGNQQLLASHTANYAHSSWEHISSLDTSSHSLITNSHYPTSRGPGPPLEAYNNFLDLSEFSRVLEEIPPGNDYTDRHFEGENCVDGNPTPYLRPFQDHKSESGFNANDPTFSQEFPSYFTDCKLLIPEPGDYHSPTSSYPERDHVSSDHGSNRRPSENPPANPATISFSSQKCTNDSDRNSNDLKVTKTKKTYQCTEYNCRKIFGRSAELKRHMAAVHEDKIANKLFNCPHEGCERVGKSGLKRKDNLVQHLRGVHGDPIGKKSGRRSTTTRMSPWSSASNAGAGSPATAIRYEQFPQGQQQKLFAYMNQQPITQEESGNPPVFEEFWEGIESHLW